MLSFEMARVQGHAFWLLNHAGIVAVVFDCAFQFTRSTELLLLLTSLVPLAIYFFLKSVRRGFRPNSTGEYLSHLLGFTRRLVGA